MESRNQRVLVVDDDASVRSAVAPVLEATGYQVTLATNGQEAITRCEKEPFDLLILDLGLPLVGGWDVFERVTTQHPMLPVIIITGMPDQFQTALMAGAAALMEKPVDAPELLRKMEELLSEPKEKRLLRIRGDLLDTQHVVQTEQADGDVNVGSRRSKYQEDRHRRRI